MIAQLAKAAVGLLLVALAWFAIATCASAIVDSLAPCNAQDGSAVPMCSTPSNTPNR
jgi:hypothetical protein